MLYEVITHSLNIALFIKSKFMGLSPEIVNIWRLKKKLSREKIPYMLASHKDGNGYINKTILAAIDVEHPTFTKSSCESSVAFRAST